MTRTDQNQWLAQHIPHRLSACLAELPLQSELFMLEVADDPLRLKIRAAYFDRAVWEGRMVAMRWLIDFVGIAANREGKPRRPTRYGDADVSIGDIEGQKIELSSPEAATLARVWLGCSQASSHPTQDSNHPPVDPMTLNNALRIIVNHLQRTIYSGTPGKLVVETLNWLGLANPISKRAS
jgi:hypothetical protein